MGVEERKNLVLSNTGCCNILLALVSRVLFRQGYVDLATMPITASERRQRLIGEWTSYGVIMALIAGFSVTIYMSPPQQKEGPTDGSELAGFGVCIILASAMNFFGVLLTVAYYSSFNIVPINLTNKWIYWHSWVLGLPNIFLIIGLSSFVGAMIIAARIVYTQGIFIFVVALVGSLFFIFIFLYVYSYIAVVSMRKRV